MRGRCDPLDYLLSGVSLQFAAKKIARAFISDTNHHDKHWSSGAQNYLAAVMIFVKCDQKLDGLDMPRTMATVAEILSDPEIEAEVLERMGDSDIAFVRDQAAAFVGYKKREYDEGEENDE